MKEINKSINKNKIASIFEIDPEARGLIEVLFTFLSMFISIKSFIIHPALRIKKEPIIK